MDAASNQVIGSILRHDNKITSYKIALLRAINDVVLSFPDLGSYRHDVAIPMRLLAEYWVAYYWGFVDFTQPIAQGQRSQRDGRLRDDMKFRPALMEFRRKWEEHTGGLSQAADGFLVSHSQTVSIIPRTSFSGLYGGRAKTKLLFFSTSDCGESQMVCQ